MGNSTGASRGEGFFHAIVVDDCRSSRTALSEFLAGRALSVLTCETLAEARVALCERSPDLILLEFSLSDGTALDLIDELNAIRPQPLVIVVSATAQPAQAFRLAQRGVRAFVSKPFDHPAIARAINAARSGPADISPHVRSLVGHLPVKRMEELVRCTMLEEALAQSAGNRRCAAKLLQVSRQALQHMLRRTS